MDIIEIINKYNPKFSPNRKNIFMIPLEYLDEVRRLAETHNVKIEVFTKRSGKYAYVKWIPRGEVKELD